MSTSKFDDMIISNANFLKPFAITFTKDKETAQDLMQETMLRALANREKYNEGTNIKAWLFTIMRNIFINNYRKETKQKIIFDHSTNNALLNYNQVSIINVAESHLKTSEIHFAIYRLSEDFKRPFLLYLFGYKYTEIAEMLNEPLGTIKSRIHYARKLLKDQIRRR